jgi:predicted outer membrane repeat protein
MPTLPPPALPKVAILELKPITWPRLFSKGPPELPGLIGASVLIAPVIVTRSETMPDVRVLPYPNGLPIALAITAKNEAGGIFNFYSTVTLTNSTVSENTADHQGGGIYSAGFGTVTLTDSEVGNNTAGVGGSIENDSAVTLENSKVIGNKANTGIGGGISNYLGTLTLTSSSVSGNTAFGGGGIDKHLRHGDAENQRGQRQHRQIWRRHRQRLRRQDDA